MASFSNGAFSSSAFSSSAFDFSSTASVGAGNAWAAANSPITNTNATTDAGNRYNVCMRTGFRIKPGGLVEDAYGALVRPESFDKRNLQEFVRPKAEELRGAIRPEPSDDLFISTSISPEDL